MESFAAGAESKLAVGDVTDGGALGTWVMIWELILEEMVFDPSVCTGGGAVWARMSEESISTVISLVFAGLSLAEANWMVDVEVSLTTQMNSC